MHVYHTWEIAREWRDSGPFGHNQTRADRAGGASRGASRLGVGEVSGLDKRISIGPARIDPRFILWQKVRVPLFIGIGLAVLVLTSAIIYMVVVAVGISGDLERAGTLAAEDTLDGQRQAIELLDRLRRAHPDHEEVLTRGAWHEALLALRYGADPRQVARVREAVDRASSGEGSALLTAARAGALLLEGDAAGALAALGDAPEGPECLFVQGLAFAREGETERALEALDHARRGTPPFLPALAELATLLRENGRFSEARAALAVLEQSSPGGAGRVAVEGVLLDLDEHDGDPAALAKLVPALAERLGRAGDAPAGMPRLRAQERYAAGRLALLQGRSKTAAEALAVARAYFSASPVVTAWCAAAHRANGDHEAALEALESFPDDRDTDQRLLRTKAEVLLDLQRTFDAAVPIEVLSAESARGSALLDGRRLLAGGDPAAAVPRLEEALDDGADEAALDLAEAFVALGQAQKARVVLRRLEGAGPLPLCAAGYLAYLDGLTQRASDRLAQASARDGRCGAVLAARLLVGTGGGPELESRLEKALALREDLRDRVALGRLRFRTRGREAARAELDRVRERGPQAVVVWSELALAYEEIGLDDEAVAAASAGIEKTREHPLLVSLAARYAIGRDATQEAEKLLADGLVKNPDSPDLLLERARLLMDIGRPDQAGPVIARAVAPGPRYDEGVCLQTEITMATGERELAHFDMVRAIGHAAEHSGAMAEARIRDCQVRIHLRRGAASLGRAKTSLYFLQQMPVRWAEVPFLEASVAREEGREDSAEESFRKALALDPAHRESWHGLAGLERLTEDDLEVFGRMWPGREP